MKRSAVGSRYAWAVLVSVAAVLALPAVGRAEFPWLSGEQEYFVTRDANVLEHKAYVKRVGEWAKDLPEGHRLKIVIGRIYRGPTHGIQERLRYAIPLDPNGQPHGTQMEFEPLWQRTPVHVIRWKHGVRDGDEEFTRDRPGGEGGERYVYKRVPWVAGVMHGTLTTYHEDGRVQMETPYVRGKREGESKSYTPKGELLRSATYRSDLLEGKAVEYWPTTRELQKVVHYKAGMSHGPAKTYYDSGKLKMEVDVWEDEFHGMMKEYNETGELRTTTYYILDEKVSEDEFRRRFQTPPVKPAPATQPAGAEQ